MNVTERHTPATPEQVWAVIADGWTFPSWVVGASRMRAVEPTWPGVGGRLHHSVGGWPALIDDETEVLESEPGRRIVLKARIRPAGEARVEITLVPQDGGTLVRMAEDFTNGPMSFLPKPAREAAIGPRNVETLRRLAFLAERRTQP
ncbi:SRPBCC family protein [Mobilicoccus pelagius]|uniref:Polyketide cyclase/dehydrase n=1 Tax=Mobilicoccus pelagius NBRC 104925 TaxID=1089455 RepID=H5UT61_9MICO|nr:SRPBCC family protein [Mobilicoccus pelagius]GAB48919.1 hypothetical protein MOPEL_085_00050 [Mobilicoccus pelagius NBRC 104925]